MKKYIALKAMKFDRYYQKGDSIPENVIAKDMINKLIRCEVLAEGGEIEQNPEEQILEQSEAEQQQNQNTEQSEAEQQENQNTEQSEAEQQENQNTEQSEAEQQENQNTTQTEQQLLQYKKEELEQMAEQKGIEVKQGMTKADIVALLLQKE